MSKDWQRGSTFMNDDVKIEKELGVGSDGYQTGNKPWQIKVRDTILVEILRKIKYNNLKGDKLWAKIGKEVQHSWMTTLKLKKN